jgi:O-antigen/teichoic acid export membrane protein
LFSIAALLGSMITPHLSCDWEAGRRDQVSARLNLFLKMLASAMVAAGVLALCVAPLLFGVAFRGKFAQGEAILPWTLIYSIWFGLAAVAQNYLWCAEKARWGSLALLVGLTVNVLLNLMLLPRLGLLGAVLATSGANALVLALVCTFDRIAGFQMDRSTWVLLALPLVLCLGPGVAAGLLAIVVLDGVVFDRLLTREEKGLLTDTVTQYAARLRNWSAGWHWPERSTA